MNAVLNKPRASRSTSSKKWQVAPTIETPESVCATIMQGLEEASKMLDSAREIGDTGDFGERAMRIAHELIDATIVKLSPTDDAMFRAQDELYDAQGVLTGVAAMHEGDGRGLLCESILAQLEALVSDMGRVQFWPKDDAPPAEQASFPGAEWSDLLIEDIRSMISESVAVMRACAERERSNLVYGAIYAAERAFDVLGAGMDAKSIDECEKASAPLGVAADVLLAALDSESDWTLYAALRLLNLAQSNLDDEIERSVKLANAGVK
ncbi:hypothetical protein ABIC94_002108 [Variovorax paradoxus]|uniref:hypothetical protein n=1 Tax=Variovorax paradoxus TaxID=34073 RepID=UPI0033997C6D